MKVNIYLETDKQCQACIQRKYGYVIEIMYHGQDRDQGRIWMCGKHISSVQPAGAYGSTVKISFFHARSVYTRKIPLWHPEYLRISDLAAGAFKDTKGNDIKNADEWKKVYERNQPVETESFFVGRSTFIFAMAPGGDDKTWKLKNCGEKDGVCAQNRIQGQ